MSTGLYCEDWVSIDEANMFILEESELEFNAMLGSIGVLEYAEAKEGIVTEGFKEKASKFKDMITGWLKSLRDKITHAWEFVIGKLQDMVDNAKRKIGDHRLKVLPKRVAKLKDKEYGKTFEYPNFDKTLECGGEAFLPVKTYMNEVNAIFASDYGEDTETVKAKLEGYDKKFLGGLGAKQDSGKSDIKDAVKKLICGNEVTINKAYIQANITDIINNVASFSSTQRKLRNGMKNIRKEFDNHINELKKAGKNDEGFSTLFGVVSPYIKKSHQYYSTVSNAVLAATKKKMHTELRIILRLTVTLRDKSGSGDKKEEATSESATFQSEIASLFDFEI